MCASQRRRRRHCADGLAPGSRRPADRHRRLDFRHPRDAYPGPGPGDPEPPRGRPGARPRHARRARPEPAAGRRPAAAARAERRVRRPGGGAAPADARARARLRRDPLLRHRHLRRRGGRRRPATAWAPTARRGGSTSPAAPARSCGVRTARCCSPGRPCSSPNSTSTTRGSRPPPPAPDRPAEASTRPELRGAAGRSRVTMVHTMTESDRNPTTDHEQPADAVLDSDGAWALEERAGPAPRRRAVDRARGRHRGRVPPAAPRAGRARGRLDDRHAHRGRELAHRARPAGRDRRFAGARRADPAARQARRRPPTSGRARPRSCATSSWPWAPTP